MKYHLLNQTVMRSPKIFSIAFKGTPVEAEKKLLLRVWGEGGLEPS